jgi:hypothetical protein
MIDPVFIGIPVFIMVGILSMYLHLKRAQARVAAWAEFARRHGLQIDRGLIQGDYEGYPLKLDLQSRGSGKSRYTVAVVRLSSQGTLPEDFSLAKEGLGDKVLKLFGKGDAEIGDKQFDRDFDLKNLSRETAKVLRQESVQQHLYEMVKHYEAFKIHRGWIQAEHRRMPSTVAELEAFTSPALMLAQTLAEASRRSKGWTTG